MATRPDPTAREKESRRILDQVARDSETVGTSSARRVAEGTRDHFLGADADPDDRVEVWGRRIGRGLSLLALVVLAVYLFKTYL
ncbi:MAG: hypothetical protein KDJ77_15200 [Rhodobiaceae bacterium]|nr:hypothetical protein [Rhodobiaceae bacterium]